MNVANVLMNLANVPNVPKVSIFNLPNMLINLPNLPNIFIPTSLVWLYSAQYMSVLCPISQYPNIIWICWKLQAREDIGQNLFEIVFIFKNKDYGAGIELTNWGLKIKNNISSASLWWS